MILTRPWFLQVKLQQVYKTLQLPFAWFEGGLFDQPHLPRYTAALLRLLRFC